MAWLLLAVGVVVTAFYRYVAAFYRAVFGFFLGSSTPSLTFFRAAALWVGVIFVVVALGALLTGDDLVR